MIQEIFDNILPGLSVAEKKTILEKQCTPEIFKDYLDENLCICFDGYKIYYKAFLEVYDRILKKPKTKKQKIDRIIKNGKRHLKFVKWWALIKKNPNCIKEIIEFSKGIYEIETHNPAFPKEFRHIHCGLPPYGLDFAEVLPFINFYETHKEVIHRHRNNGH